MAYLILSIKRKESAILFRLAWAFSHCLAANFDFMQLLVIKIFNFISIHYHCWKELPLSLPARTCWLMGLILSSRNSIPKNTANTGPIEMLHLCCQPWWSAISSTVWHERHIYKCVPAVWYCFRPNGCGLGVPWPCNFGLWTAMLQYHQVLGLVVL